MQGPDTRPSLLFKLRDPSQHQAWNEFVEIYQPLIYRLARAKGLQHADALDVVQEVLAAVNKAIERFDPLSGRGTFRGWLFRIARNLMINYLARSKDPPGSGDSAVLQFLNQQPAADHAATSAFQWEYRRQVFRWAARRVESKVSQDAWQAFWLAGVEGRRCEDAARLLDKSPGAIRIARCRVLAKLRQEVTQFDS